jgi:hypothetical protein
MKHRDALGHELSGADEASLTHYEGGLRQLQCFIGDPVTACERALEASPGFLMAHVLKGYLFALSTDREAMAVARESWRTASELRGTGREVGHVRALGALTSGGWHEAGHILADIAAEHPRDALALQAGHQIDFFTGNAAMLRDRIGRALPAWDEAMPGYHAVLSAHAFGLEENGDYSAAEVAGRRAADLQPRDGWAQHAVAHVMEMQGRQRDGIAWMRANPEAWSAESFLQVHNWWHLALFHYELGEVEEVLALVDGPIFGNRSRIVLNMVDASAILWRLHLGGIDAGGRWNALADLWAPMAKAGNYAFNDIHAMMAFAAAGRAQAARDLLEAQREAIDAGGDNARFTRDVGHPVSLAIKAFGEGDYAAAARLLQPIRAVAHSFGGSHAQRDVIELTLIEAAIRAGDSALAARLSAERARSKPESPLSRVFLDRASSLQPR